MSTTQTRAASQSATLSNIIPVARKVEADLLAIIDTYGCANETWGNQVMHDVRILLDEEVVEKVYMVWTRPGSNVVLDAYAYRVIIAGFGVADDRSGNIRYRPELATADFNFRVEYKQRWWSMSGEDKRSILERLQLRWTASGALNYSNGYWSNDKTYSSGDFGMARDRFISRPR